MPRIEYPKLDLRFEALEAIPDPDAVYPGSTGDPESRLFPRAALHRAIVMLAPGARRREIGGEDVVELPGNTFTVTATLRALRELSMQPDVVYVEASRPAVLELNASVPAIGADQNWARPTALQGQGVIIGIIDDGLDVTHGDFIDATGSRVLSLWDQKLTPQHGESSPAGFSYGVEYKQSNIDAKLKGAAAHSVRHKPRLHGTHVTGIAAGNGQRGASAEIGVAPEADIVFVSVAMSKGGLSSSTSIADAIAYIFDFAERAGKPAVINISMGHNGGRHDGESAVERTVDRMLEKEGRAFVKSAGNEAQWRTHVSGRLYQVGNTNTLEWEFRTNDRTPNELEVWYSSRDRFQVEVGDPNGNWTPAVDPGNVLATALADPVNIASERFHALNGQSRIHVRVGQVNPGGAAVLPGIWAIRLTAVEIVDGAFDAWIELDRRDHTNGYHDQSQFVSATPDKTITPPGTIRRGVAVANYDFRPNPPSIAANSSQGPTGDDRLKPELAAPGTHINSSYGDPASRPPSYIAMSGTSMSAPHVTGVIAQMLQKCPKLTAAQIRAILIASATQPHLGWPAPFDIQWGYGVVDAVRAVDLIP